VLDPVALPYGGPYPYFLFQICAPGLRYLEDIYKAGGICRGARLVARMCNRDPYMQPEDSESRDGIALDWGMILVVDMHI
jgi:hypothetical protein